MKLLINIPLIKTTFVLANKLIVHQGAVKIAPLIAVRGKFNDDNGDYGYCSTISRWYADYPGNLFRYAVYIVNPWSGIGIDTYVKD